MLFGILDLFSLNVIITNNSDRGSSTISRDGLTNKITRNKKQKET